MDIDGGPRLSAGHWAKYAQPIVCVCGAQTCRGPVAPLAHGRFFQPTARFLRQDDDYFRAFRFLQALAQGRGDFGGRQVLVFEVQVPPR